MSRPVPLLILVSLLMVSVVTACATDEGAAGPASSSSFGEVGATPSFSLPDVDGNPTAIDAFRGKVVVVDFWASWCAPCKEAMPFYEELQHQFEDDLVVVGINLDTERAALDEALRQRPVSFLVLHDPQGEVAKQFNVETMPSSYILDRDGKVAYVHHGFVESDRDTLRKTVEQLIAQ